MSTGLHILLWAWGITLTAAVGVLVILGVDG